MEESIRRRSSDDNDCNSALSSARAAAQNSLTIFLINNNVDVDLVLQATDEFAPRRQALSLPGLACMSPAAAQESEYYTEFVKDEQVILKNLKDGDTNRSKEIVQHALRILVMQGVSPDTVEQIAKGLGSDSDSDAGKIQSRVSLPVSTLLQRSFIETIKPGVEEGSSSITTGSLMPLALLEDGEKISFSTIAVGSTTTNAPSVPHFTLVLEFLIIIMVVVAVFKAFRRGPIVVSERVCSWRESSKFARMARDMEYGTISETCREEYADHTGRKAIYEPDLEERFIMVLQFGTIKDM